MSAPKFPKIDSLYDRDPETFLVDETKIRRPEFLVPQEWIVTEKIDGMNIRVSLEEEIGLVHPGNWQVKYYGRNENSQFPPLMLEHLQKTFTLEKMRKLWRCKESCVLCRGYGEFGSNGIHTVCPNIEPYQITLYGEGYGAGIQRGGGYNKDKTFRLFDVLIGDTWLSRDNVEDVADQLDILCAPLVRLVDVALRGIVEYVRKGFPSHVAIEEGEEGIQAEGIVAVTNPVLFNSRGQRLCFKLKTKDFVAGKR